MSNVRINYQFKDHIIKAEMPDGVRNVLLKAGYKVIPEED